MASEEDLKAEIERLRAENESLKKPARGQISLKVSEKGGLSVYGLGRFPVTLYLEQWEKLLGLADDIRRFIRDNYAALKKGVIVPTFDAMTPMRTPSLSARWTAASISCNIRSASKRPLARCV